ncbi:hypothetical protein SAMD00019534_010230 [Acytostelium subglobosum LB1]|uniref:hypothetical protein n=1 Tax=Acytostelium subglobosum LB1 TaxID=1410327 RepID=UPI000645173D|nr:hypothetical protein SAMD00019534_010230 [Acytostelium subglobosum LB1]GAM17848.1 hypothetical protein SAMD00019534_010230 [Acytostelium subglobosum LB1]|eukprot:XP_012758444.1 hypothetical protein SAMD00019534_010230 [Acytostelium subglobosum LB1]
MLVLMLVLVLVLVLVLGLLLLTTDSDDGGDVDSGVVVGVDKACTTGDICIGDVD